MVSLPAAALGSREGPGEDVTVTVYPEAEYAFTDLTETWTESQGSFVVETEEVSTFLDRVFRLAPQLSSGVLCTEYFLH